MPDSWFIVRYSTEEQIVFVLFDVWPFIYCQARCRKPISFHFMPEYWFLIRYDGEEDDAGWITPESSEMPLDASTVQIQRFISEDILWSCLLTPMRWACTSSYASTQGIYTRNPFWRPSPVPLYPFVQVHRCVPCLLMVITSICESSCSAQSRIWYQMNFEASICDLSMFPFDSHNFSSLRDWRSFMMSFGSSDSFWWYRFHHSFRESHSDDIAPHHSFCESH